MAETAVKLGFGDFGGTGVRGYAFDPAQRDLSTCDTFNISLDEIEGEGHLQQLVDENFGRLAEEGNFRYGGVTLAVDGPEDREYRLGTFTSHKTKQRIDPEITANALGAPAEAMNDVMAMAHGLKAVKASELVGKYIVRGSGRDIADGFRDTRAVVVTVSSGVGASLFNPQADGSVQITSMHKGHQGWQPKGFLEKRLHDVRSAAHRHQGYSEIVTVEQAIAGGNILQLLDLVDRDYADDLRHEHGDDFNTIGKLVVSHALQPGHMNYEVANEAMGVRAAILGTAVRDFAAAQEAQAVVLTGGGMVGLEPWVMAPEGEFKRRVSASHPEHAYRLGHIILGPQDLSLRGGMQHARELAGI